jgi:hypothetical protein
MTAEAIMRRSSARSRVRAPLRPSKVRPLVPKRSGRTGRRIAPHRTAPHRIAPADASHRPTHRTVIAHAGLLGLTTPKSSACYSADGSEAHEQECDDGTLLCNS